MSGAEVRKQLGTPNLYRQYIGDTRRDLFPDAAGVVPPKPGIGDVYELRTAMNSYEIEMQYSFDDSQSQLHPVPRVIFIRIRPDKRVAKVAYLNVLRDIPEVVTICQRNCQIRTHVTSFLDMALLNPISMTTDEMQRAQWIGSEFGRYGPPKGLVEVDVRFGRSSVETVMISINRLGFHADEPVRGIWNLNAPVEQSYQAVNSAGELGPPVAQAVESQRNDELLSLDPGRQASVLRSAIKMFQSAHPCPTSGKTTGKCLGHYVGFIIDPHDGGKLSLDNMTWKKLRK